MNVFSRPEIALAYDGYYEDEFGRQVDDIERRLFEDLLGDIPRASMLELGCGTGHWTRFFTGLGFDVTAIDASAPMLEQAKQKHISAAFGLARAEDLPFENESFACVSAVTVLEFVENADAALDEAYRVLAADGWLLLGCLNADSQLARNSAGNEVFSGARFMAPEQLIDKLQRFGQPVLSLGVHLDENFQLLDGTPERVAAEPAFMAAAVQKVF